MPLCWQEPKCLPYLDCSITLSFLSQFNPNANDTFTILYISQFSVAFLPLKTKYDFKGQCADRHHWEKMISNQGALATEWHCNYLWCPAEQTNRHIHCQISSRGRKKKLRERTKQVELFWNCSSVSPTRCLSSPSHLFLTLLFLSHLSIALSSFLTLPCLLFI